MKSRRDKRGLFTDYFIDSLFILYFLLNFTNSYFIIYRIFIWFALMRPGLKKSAMLKNILNLQTGHSIYNITGASLGFQPNQGKKTKF